MLRSVFERAGDVLEVRSDVLDVWGAPAALCLSDLVIAEPEVAGPLTLFPLLAQAGEFEYCSFAEAVSRGFVLAELEEAEVNDLRAENPLDVAVWLFDGELVQGSLQDRVPDVSVLVSPGVSAEIPVVCVEQGRWEDDCQVEPFAASSDAMAPSLRAIKNGCVRAALAEGLDARADQEQVWERIEVLLEDFEVKSSTGAMRDAYTGHGERLLDLETGVRRHDGQVGALVYLSGRPVVLDYVSRPDVWAALWRPLLRGYCLDALACGDEGPHVSSATAEEFLAAADAITAVRHDTVGTGDLLTLTSEHAAGSGLIHGRELIQASVFAR